MIASEKFFLIAEPSQKFHVNDTISSPVSLSVVVDASKVTSNGSVHTVSGLTIIFPTISSLFTVIGIVISVFAPLGSSSIIIFAS